ncbi:lecithin:cholesterol acyltransferase family protein [Salix suchowensis]|nr:lecithin:cholesterol acyltransferase family protein [Salix suchowensis]
MASILRFRKLCYVEPVKFQFFQPHNFDKKEKTVATEAKTSLENNEKRNKRQPKERSCVNSCCCVIGYMCTTWWLLLVLYHCLPAAFPGFQVPESPGTRLKREGLTALHPVVLVPGIVTGGLELWEGKPCAEGLFRRDFGVAIVFAGASALHNETGLDPPGIRLRALSGLVAADYFAPGYFVWAVLIENLAKIGYEGKNMHMAAYDWRLSFQNTEIRDQTLSRLKSQIELMYVTNGYKKVVVVPHSMGVIYFLHFLKWVETPPPMGGGGGPGWCGKHIKSIMNIGPVFLGVPKQAMDPGVLDSEILRLQALEHVMRVTRTWDSIASLLPKGGETVWGNLDWSPEEGYACDLSKKRYLQASAGDKDTNGKSNKYGRIISFGKETLQLPSSQLPSVDTEEFLAQEQQDTNSSCGGEVWTEYDEMCRETIRKIAENKPYTARTALDLLRFHLSYGIADNLDDPKYTRYKHCSVSGCLMHQILEIYCSYGVGIPTERSYVYKLSPNDRCRSIPFRIDSSVDGDETTVPVISAGFMCAKGWRGRTRFNPSGIATFIREYRHKPPASLLEGRGLESGAHVDIMGNFALIEDVLRVAAGATGAEIGGDRVHSDIFRMSDRINLRL